MYAVDEPYSKYSTIQIVMLRPLAGQLKTAGGLVKTSRTRIRVHAETFAGQIYSLKFSANQHF
jgi:hypothetical protein